LRVSYVFFAGCGGETELNTKVILKGEVFIPANGRVYLLDYETKKKIAQAPIFRNAFTLTVDSIPADKYILKIEWRRNLTAVATESRFRPSKECYVMKTLYLDPAQDSLYRIIGPDQLSASAIDSINNGYESLTTRMKVHSEAFDTQVREKVDSLQQLYTDTYRLKKDSLTKALSYALATNNKLPLELKRRDRS